MNNHIAVRKVDGRLMQQANRAMVLNLVRADPSASRAAIVRQTGLSPAAVTMAACPSNCPMRPLFSPRPRYVSRQDRLSFFTPEVIQIPLP